MNPKMTSMRNNRRRICDPVPERVSKENKHPNAHLFLQNTQNQIGQFSMTTKPKSNLKTPQANISMFPHRKQSRCLYDQRPESQLTRSKAHYASLADAYQSHHPNDLKTGHKNSSRPHCYFLNPGFSRKSETPVEKEFIGHSTKRGNRVESIPIKADSKRKSRSRLHSKSNINIFNPVINLNQSISIGCLHSKVTCPSVGLGNNGDAAE